VAIFVLAGNTLLRPVVHYIARLPISPEGAEALIACTWSFGLDGRRLPVRHGATGIHDFLAGQRQRNTVNPIAADVKGLATAVQAVVQPKSYGSTGTYEGVHAIAVGDLVAFRLRLEVLEGSVGQHFRLQNTVRDFRSLSTSNFSCVSRYLGIKKTPSEGS
jgi:hypothetical protein